MADKQTYTFSNDITTVEVSSLGAKIVVIPQDRADIYVEYDNPKDSPEFCAVLSGKTLTLKESFSFSIFGSKPAEGYTITVYLPLRTFEKLKINTASGGVEVGEVSAEQFSLNTASGNIDISAYFNDVKLQSASGSIKLTNPLADKEKQEQTVSLDKEETAPAKYVSKSVSVCTVSGNAVVSGYRAEEFGIHSVSGTTTVNGISGKGKTLNMDADTIAKIFDGKITKWNDPAIADQNKDLKLPDTAITVVHRSDKSGTTQNFVSYFKDVTPDNWTYDLSENWPNEVGQGAKGTSGVISTVKQADGTIGYADFSQVGDLGTVAVKVGDKYNEISAEAGSKVIGDSKQDDTVKGDNRIVIKINHATEAEGAYPIVLVSYDIVCPAYKDTKQAEFAKAWLTYVTSDEGQKAAQDAAGTAPLPSSLKSEITKSIEAIKTK